MSILLHQITLRIGSGVMPSIICHTELMWTWRKGQPIFDKLNCLTIEKIQTNGRHEAYSDAIIEVRDSIPKDIALARIGIAVDITNAPDYDPNLDDRFDWKTGWNIDAFKLTTGSGSMGIRTGDTTTISRLELLDRARRILPRWRVSRFPERAEFRVALKAGMAKPPKAAPNNLALIDITGEDDMMLCACLAMWIGADAGEGFEALDMSKFEIRPTTVR